jgi:hypothetical protein
MTTLTRKVRRRVNGLDRSGPLTVTLYPSGTIGFRPYRAHTEFLLSLGAVYVRAAENHLAHKRAERKKARRRRSRG